MRSSKIESVCIVCLILFIFLNEQSQTNFKREIQLEEQIRSKYKLDSLQQLVDDCHFKIARKTE
ncbi:hypothetical protein [uncultured Dokdonia sp.]|uniref:hypothetical protein n=1 Tax=uncultured Dokdonia sp. TaxID=575653 RepID=UPI00260FADFC|nr:hypothetical protein [uncultured Dokdonia sp.]